MLMSYICGTTVSRSKNAAPNEYGHLWEEIEQNRPLTVKEKFGALLIPMGIVMHIIGLKGTHGTPNLITMDALVIYRRD